MRMDMKQNKGVTLIALIVTIIVLIILAGITITALNNENDGVINQANDAKRSAELADWNERIDIAIVNAEEKNLNPAMGDVIDELIRQDIIDSESQVDTETGKITTNAPSYVIEGKLDDYIQLNKPTEVTVANYGDRVNYISRGDSSLKWRIFYDDENYVYLISSKADGTSTVDYFTLETYPGSNKTYKGSSDITNIFLQSLNSQWFATLDNTPSSNDNAKLVAYLMDQDVWDEYKDSERNASYAIGGPTLELYIKSYNATSIENEREYQIEITGCTTTGYSQNTKQGWLSTEYNNGIYNNGIGQAWCLASPSSSYVR